MPEPSVWPDWQQAASHELTFRPTTNRIKVRPAGRGNYLPVNLDIFGIRSVKKFWSLNRFRVMSKLYLCQVPRASAFNPRPAGPSPTPALDSGGGGGGSVATPRTISGTNRRRKKINRHWMRSIISSKKSYLLVTWDVTGQVKHKMFNIFHGSPSYVFFSRNVESKRLTSPRIGMI